MITDWNSAYRERPYLATQPDPGVEALTADLKNRGARRVLDLGCGDGRHLILLAREGFLAAGVDNALWGLLRSAAWAGQEGLAADLACAHMGRLPWAANCFGGVISIQVIHHQRLAAIRETVSEVRRVLRPGGLFYFTVPKITAKALNSQEFSEIEERTFVPLQGFEKGVPHHFFLEDELPALLDGFEVIHTGSASPRYLSGLALKPAG